MIGCFDGLQQTWPETSHLITQEVVLSCRCQPAGLVLCLASERTEKEVELAMAVRRGGHWFGRGWRGDFPRLLAPQNELAGTLPGSFLSGLPGLRHQTPVR